jgi:DNA-binding LacI/PurR family transcriptional regulator
MGCSSVIPKKQRPLNTSNLQLKKGLPIVHFDRVCNEVETAKVVQEDYEGSFLLVEHLIQQGCRRIAVCAGPRELLISNARSGRLQGRVGMKYGIPLNEELVYHSDFKKRETLLALDRLASVATTT